MLSQDTIFAKTILWEEAQGYILFYGIVRILPIPRFLHEHWQLNKKETLTRLFIYIVIHKTLFEKECTHSWNGG